jgi:hypothetical protein
MSPILQAVNGSALRVQLRRGETLLVKGCGSLRCDTGEVWLTEAGNCRDNILQRGDQWRLQRGIDVALSSVAGASLTLSGWREPGA